MKRPLILLTNDDGVAARGLTALRSELEALAQVVVCAPELNQSAVSHGLTLQNVLRLRRVDASTFALDGTPADCVYVALGAGERILPRRPGLVVSGMNHGPNLGVDINYSGTVAAAREAALRGVSAVAISTDPKTDSGAAAALAAELVRRLLQHEAAEGERHGAPLLLNVNIPAGAGWQLRVTRQGGRPYAVDVVSRTDPRGHEYLWIGTGELDRSLGAPAESDTAAFFAGRVSVTPLRVDLSADDQRERVRRIVAGA